MIFTMFYFVVKKPYFGCQYLYSLYGSLQNVFTPLTYYLILTTIL